MKKKITIDDIVFNKKNIVLICGKKKITISNDIYLSNYFYPGKEIDEDDFYNLIIQSNYNKAKSYIEKQLSIHRYTYKQALDKLMNKYSLDFKHASIILLPYVESHIIDDKEYAIDYAESKIDTGYGKHYIDSQLLNKGIDKKILESEEYLDLFSYEISLQELIARFDKAKERLTIQKRKESIFSLLVRRGFSLDVVKSEIDIFYSHLSPDKLKEDEKKKQLLLKDNAFKCYNLINKRNVPVEKKKQLFIQRLISKGFSYQEILKEIEREGYFND